MKKIITSAGLVAVGASGLQGAYAPGLNEIQSSKLLTYSISARGFYDDNITTASKSSGAIKDSFGMDIRPSISLNLTSLQQTFVGATYTYGLRYYADRSPDADHSHQFDLRTEHAFTERYKLTFDDSFIYAQEPEVIGDVGVVKRLLKSNSSAYHNTAHLGFTGQLTEVIGTRVSYENQWINYLDSNPLGGSRSATLDRFEHQFRLEGTWLVDPKLTARAGYRLSLVDYTSSEPIIFGGPANFTGDLRNQKRHTGFLGADYSFNPRAKASIEGGAQYTTFDHAEAGQSAVTPYVSISGTYLYREKSYLQLGLTVDRSATDVIGSLNAIASDVETISPYISISHQLTPRVTLGGLVRYNQYTYNATGTGSIDGQKEDFIIAQINADYRISEHWTATASYNFDDLSSSDANFKNRAFTRNRVFLGVTASY